MRINFFEEYPTDENMKKLGMITWPSTLLIASPTLSEFEDIKNKYSKEYPHITFGWWPTVKGSYWLSAFSNPQDIQNLFAELTLKVQESELPVLLDLELPFKKELYAKNFFKMHKNVTAIHSFIDHAKDFNLKIYTAEYPSFNSLLHWLWNKLGISPSFKYTHTRLSMCYSSMVTKSFGVTVWNSIKRFETHLAKKHTNRVGFGLGTIATGVFENEPILSPEKLKSDLEWAKESGVSEVFIFRLGGMNEEYLKVIQSL